MARRRTEEKKIKPTTWALIIGGVALAGGAIYLATRKSTSAATTPSLPVTSSTPPTTVTATPTPASPSSSRPTYTMVAADKQIALRVGDVLEIDPPSTAPSTAVWNAYSASPTFNPGDQNDTVQPLYGGPTIGIPGLFVAAHPGPAKITVNLSDTRTGGELATFTINVNVSA